MPIQPINMVEASIPEEVLDTRTGLRREILMIFNSWHKEPLTAEKIKVQLEAKGLAVKIETIYGNLEALEKNNILIKKSLPSKNKRGRPPYSYELNPNAVYDQFRLLEDLLDACGFDPIECDKSGIACIMKYVCVAPEGVPILPGFERVRSVRNAFNGGELGLIYRRAKPEDFEKTWRLEQFIKKLQDRCNTDSTAYKSFREDREYQEIVEQCKRHNMRIPEKEDTIYKPIKFKMKGPLTFFTDIPE
jgi:hypothetical protein